MYGWILTRPDGRQPVPDDITHTVSWLHSHSPPVVDLADLARLRAVLESLALTIDGRQASNSTIAKRRSALHNCLDYAVERKLLTSNPLADIKRKRLPPTAAIDRRRVANPSQAQALLASVAERDPALEAFFATIHYAGARPGEVINLRFADCKLPKEGWGDLLLNSSYQRPGTTWTGTTDPSEERQLKHRAVEDTRPVPAHPRLVATLRRHLRTFESGVDGRLFVSRIGRGGAAKPRPFTDPVSMNTVYRAGHRARGAALSEREFASSLARRPYDLRHACLSNWLNAGVAPTQVAEWAGHSLNVLLSIYAKCLDGQQDAAMRRIEGLFDGEDAQ